MKRALLVTTVLALTGASYLLGDRYGAPEPVREVRDRALGRGAETLSEADAYARERLAEAARFSFDGESLPPPPDLSGEEIAAVIAAFRARVAEGAPAEPAPEAAGGAAGEGDAAPALIASTDDALPLCPRMTVTNAPSAAQGIVDAPGRVVLSGVALRVNAAPGACLSSGFGQRNGKLHKGIDLHHPDAVPVLAAAAGTVVEAGYRDDYGNYVVVDHGGGAYTRYSHLASLGRGVRAGAQVGDGQALGPMGDTASYPIPVHLHYEILSGDYDTPKKAFGLTPEDPFGLPAAPTRTASL